MKRLLTILLVICSVSVFGQKRPAPTPAPTSLTTFTFSVNADSSLNAYSGSTWLWWQILSKYQADKLYQPLGSPVATPFSLSAGYGLSGSSFNGSVARTFTADTASADGLVSKSRLATNLGGYVPSSRTITINGSTRDLSTNRIWNVGTVLSITPAYGLTPQTAITSSGTFRVDTAAIQTVANFFPKGDTRYVPNTRTITAGTGLSGGGDLSANRTISADTTVLQTVLNFFPKGDTRYARTGFTGTVTSVGITAGTAISVSGSPITTSGNITVNNTAPDQTVVLNAGTGISTSGTYPNFTITNTAPATNVTYSVTLDSNGEYDFTATGIRTSPAVTIYDSSGNTAPYFYNNTTKKITGGVPSEAITVTFI